MKKSTQRELNKDHIYTELQKDILASLVYFNIFQFPLKQSEIQNLLKNHFSEKLIIAALVKLISLNKIFKYDGYYTCVSEVQKLTEKRIKNERNASVFFNRVPFFVRLISRFPFVRAIAISGSLSKGVLHDKGDVDYFIITKEGRLWLARTLLVVFKKVFLFNSKKYFCVNYFISENNLRIEDENRFTATEISYLIPVYNADLVQEFKWANNWLHKYYGHFIHNIKLKEQTRDWKFLKRSFEFLLRNRLGDWLDLFFLKITLNKWSKKFETFSPEKFELTMRSRSDISKHHPQDFQTKVLEKFEGGFNAVLRD